MLLSWIKSKLTKSEIVSFGVLKRVQIAVSHVHFIDLNNDTSKILGTHFSYYEELKEEKTFHETGIDTQRVLKYEKLEDLH